MEDQLFAAPPTVKVGGKPYQVRYAHGSLYLLSTWGIDAHRLISTLNELFFTGRHNEAMAKIAAAGLGTMDRDGQWRSLGMTPLEISDLLSDEEAVQLDKTAWAEFSKKHGLVLKSPETEPAPSPDPAPKTDGLSSGASPLPPTD